jgi:hypothetical protein
MSKLHCAVDASRTQRAELRCRAGIPRPMDPHHRPRSVAGALRRTDRARPQHHPPLRSRSTTAIRTTSSQPSTRTVGYPQPNPMAPSDLQSPPSPAAKSGSLLVQQRIEHAPRSANTHALAVVDLVQARAACRADSKSACGVVGPLTRVLLRSSDGAEEDPPSTSAVPVWESLSNSEAAGDVSG